MTSQRSQQQADREPLWQPGDTHSLSIPNAEVMKEVYFDDVTPMVVAGETDFTD